HRIFEPAVSDIGLERGAHVAGEDGSPRLGQARDRMARGRRADRHAVEKSAYRLEARRAVFGLEGDLPEPGQHGRRAYLFGVGKRTRALSRSGIDTLPLQCGYNRAMPRVCFERSPDARDE